MKKLQSSFALSIVLSSSLYADTIHLESIGVEAAHAEEMLQERVLIDTKDLARQAKGETLGDYLDQELFVDSASYGPAVGRPVMKGMDGYRVGVSQGDIILNDLSAMSQDHAVGVVARTSEKIELLKGPSSLLYGSYSGGIVRVLGEEHQKSLFKEGFGADLSLQKGGNGAGELGALTLRGREGDFSVYLSGSYHEAESYKDANGKEIQDSDTQSQQLHLVLGYRINDNNTLKVYADTMQKAYGIPNTTSRPTTIDMEQERYGLVLHTSKPNELIEYAQTEISYSDYLHSEYEGQSADGLFGQEQFALSSLLGFDLGAWHSDLSLGYTHSSLEVCHEHGRCTSFYDASRNPNSIDGVSLQEYLDVKGLAYSHAHPMPNTQEQNFKLGLSLKNFYDENNEFTFALRTELRTLDIDSKNIQQEWLVTEAIDPSYYDSQQTNASSLSIGWFSFLSDTLSLQSSLGYVERLPAASELLWNGFHHATNTYIFGDRSLKNERSYNLDLELMHTAGALTSQWSGFYYHFENYIYQTPLADAQGTTLRDPFHLSDVWAMQGVGAKVYGVALKESYRYKQGGHTLIPSLQLEAIRGELKSGGNIPRLPPFSATLTLEHSYANYMAKLSYKYVDKSRYEATNETNTPNYNWLSAFVSYDYKKSFMDAKIYLKGENLTNKQAYNHLSFLKQSAPLPGRQVQAGVDIKF